MKFSIKDFFIKFDQIRSWSHLLKKSLMENFIFCAVVLLYQLNFLKKVKSILKYRNKLKKKQTRLYKLICYVKTNSL